LAISMDSRIRWHQIKTVRLDISHHQPGSIHSSVVY
jgi:hypothetical protein